MDKKSKVTPEQISAFLLEEFETTGNQALLEQYQTLIEGFVSLLDDFPVPKALSLDKNFPNSHMWAVSQTMGVFLSKFSFFMIGQEALSTTTEKCE